MSKIYGQGAYTIKLNDFGKPSLYEADGTTPLDDPTTFMTTGNASIVFQVLENTSAGAAPLVFSNSPISWSGGQNSGESPAGNRHQVDSGTLLTLSVSPPPLSPAAVTYHFTLELNLGGITDGLWSHDGKRRIDPTIIEKPPEA
jgi:hypothetical protein